MFSIIELQCTLIEAKRLTYQAYMTYMVFKCTIYDPDTSGRFWNVSI